MQSPGILGGQWCHFTGVLSWQLIVVIVDRIGNEIDGNIVELQGTRVTKPGGARRQPEIKASGDQRSESHVTNGLNWQISGPYVVREILMRGVGGCKCTNASPGMTDRWHCLERYYQHPLHLINNWLAVMDCIISVPPTPAVLTVEGVNPSCVKCLDTVCVTFIFTHILISAERAVIEKRKREWIQIDR